MSFQDDEEIVNSFIAETMDQLAEIESGILKLENESGLPDGELVHSMFRAAHSIKAGANLLDFWNIEALSHTMENDLQDFRNQKRAIDDNTITNFLRVIDAIRDLAEDPLVRDPACSSTFVNQLRENHK